MSDFFDRMVARATGAAASVRPVIPPTAERIDLGTFRDDATEAVPAEAGPAEAGPATWPRGHSDVDPSDPAAPRSAGGPWADETAPASGTVAAAHAPRRAGPKPLIPTPDPMDGMADQPRGVAAPPPDRPAGDAETPEGPTPPAAHGHTMAAAAGHANAETAPGPAAALVTPGAAATAARQSTAAAAASSPAPGPIESGPMWMPAARNPVVPGSSVPRQASTIPARTEEVPAAPITPGRPVAAPRPAVAGPEPAGGTQRPAPVVRLTIDRLEVRASPPPAPPQPAPPQPPAAGPPRLRPPISLDDYLRQRRDRRR